jgi:alpha-L-fucosidase 2
MKSGWIASLVVLIGTVAAAQGPSMTDQLDAYNVVWDSPSKDVNGTMPIGNGQTALNVWWQENGDLQFFIARTDAWDQAGRLVKVGKVRIALDPNPVKAGQAFRQTLDLKSGTIDFALGQGDQQVRVRLWVDANQSVIHVDMEGKGETKATATIE